MIKKIDKASLFFIITIVFTWVFWTISMSLSITNGISIPYNDNIIIVLVNGYDKILQFLMHFIFSLGVYGPIIAYLIMAYYYKTKLNFKFKKINYKYLGFVLIYPIIVFTIGLLFGGINLNLAMPLIWLPVLLIYQLITSGLEEFGWRHYLQPILVKKHGIIKAFYMIGIMWSIWHFPFIIFINYQAGFLNTIIALIGFTALTIPQAFVMGYVYDKTKNIWLLVLFHAWSNVMSYYILGLANDAMVGSIVVAIITWLVASYIESIYKKELTI